MVEGSADFPPFRRVLLAGLAKAELNGRIAVVLPPESEAETQRLAESGRVKVSNYPKALALRPENLITAPAPDFVTKPLPFTMLQVARSDRKVMELCRAADMGGIGKVGDISDAFEFAETLWRIYGQVPAASPLPEDVISLVLDTPGHWLYWMGLEQIGHHILIEACDGSWRGYQSFKGSQRLSRADGASETDICPVVNSFGGVLVETSVAKKASQGYTARDWLTSPTTVKTQPLPESSNSGESQAVSGPEDAVLVDIWYTELGNCFEIISLPSGLCFHQIRSDPYAVLEGMLIPDGDDRFLVDLYEEDRADVPVGTVRLKLVENCLELNFKAHGERIWGPKETAESLRHLQKELDADRSRASEFDRLASEKREEAQRARAEVVECERLAAGAEERAVEAESLATDAFTRLASAEQRITEVSEAAKACRASAAPVAAVGAEPAAQALWGGGRDLARGEIAEVIGLVVELKEKAQAISAELQEQAATLLKRKLEPMEAAEWAQSLLEASEGGARLSLVPDRPSSPRTAKGYSASEEVWVVTESDVKPSCDLSVHSRLAFPFMRSYARLTGEFPDATTLLRILELAGWEDLERDDGSSVGWTLRSLNLRGLRSEWGELGA
mmetsp:Transcript_80670/g.159815  ORF Transcript_80670/g.159815 Transcript_80670/m.159815 type:complete len:618 (+) Transcript_80670:64-1917(+)|eukprot:CAMPEP_0172750964 /NCGR_PEP_ID=MMETSP1074-20121228/150618_1 /TAXON_ID=2916 /ORGANISM="Ceratium fusus, Strain PA161109" /LENGTH=617 /DNA_ID=CAMNT_0013583189 /DNA_START=42 /DNA_END=1895 /DNA_ORIENTATION=+